MKTFLAVVIVRHVIVEKSVRVEISSSYAAALSTGVQLNSSGRDTWAPGPGAISRGPESTRVSIAKLRLCANPKENIPKYSGKGELHCEATPMDSGDRNPEPSASA